MNQSDFDNLMNTITTTLRSTELKWRLETTKELQQNNWNCYCRNNSNGTVSYHWNAPPSNKTVFGQDCDILQIYDAAGRHLQTHWDYIPTWTSARDINIGILRIRDIADTEEDDSTSSESPTSRRRLDFN